jgi:hypothetical protein
MFGLPFLRIYTTFCHSVLQVVRYGQQMIGRQHVCLYLGLEHPEFKIASEAPYITDHIRVSQSIYLQTRYLYRQFVRSVLEHHPVVFDVFVTATSFPRSAWQKV